MVSQSRESFGFGTEARVPVDSNSLKEISELGGNERETGADDGCAFASAREDEEGDGVICRNVQRRGKGAEGKLMGVKAYMRDRLGHRYSRG